LEGLIAIGAYVLLLGGVGAIITIAVGKLTRWHWRITSIAAGALLAPICIAVYGIWLIHFHRSGPPSDVNGLAAVTLILLPVISLPITIWSSVAVARRIAWVKGTGKDA